MEHVSYPHLTLLPTMTSKCTTLIDKSSEIIISSTEVTRNIYKANTIKREVYDFIFLWNPNSTQAMNHPSTQILTVLGF